MSQVEASTRHIAELASLLLQMPSWMMPHSARLMASFAQGAARTANDKDSTTNWQTILASGISLSNCPWFHALNPMQRVISAVVMTMNQVSPESLTSVIATQRTAIRAGNMRRSDDIEVLTSLVLLTANQLMNAIKDVARMHSVYEQLKLDHWWPIGPEDLPLSALIAALPGDFGKNISAIESTFTSFSEKDEVPSDPLDVVLLAWSGGMQNINVTLEQHQELRTGFILSGIPLGSGDALALSRLAVVDQAPDLVVEQYRSLRQQYTQCLGAVNSSYAAECAADAIIFDRDESVAVIHRAGLILRLWMSQRNQSPSMSWPL
jgi:hypothetical protein